MDARCQCGNCGKFVDFDAEHAGKKADCPFCGKEIVLLLTDSPSVGATNSNKQSKAATKLAQDRLEFIRANSCYRVLRALINVGSVFIGIVAMIEIKDFLGYQHWDEGNNPLMVIGPLACLVLGVIFAIAVRQSAFLLIDIADMLLHHQSTDKN